MRGWGLPTIGGVVQEGWRQPSEHGRDHSGIISTGGMAGLSAKGVS